MEFKRRVFSEIRPGEQFTLEVDPLHMVKYVRLSGHALNCIPDVEIGDEVKNAVNLKNGTLEVFDDMSTVFTFKE
jgi:hypothetical protein